MFYYVLNFIIFFYKHKWEYNYWVFISNKDFLKRQLFSPQKLPFNFLIDLMIKFETFLKKDLKITHYLKIREA